MASNVVRPEFVRQIEPWRGFSAGANSERPAPREWAVDGVVPFGCLTLLAGGPKQGKSLLMMQLQASAALGMPWIGLHTEKCRCLGKYPEDETNEVERRLFNICGAYREEKNRLYDFDYESRDDGNDPPKLLPTKIFEFKRGSDEPLLTKYGETLWEKITSGKYRLNCLDNATLLLGGNVINHIELVTNCLRALTNLAAQTHSAIIISAHTNRLDPGSFSGPNAWLGTVRSGMNLRQAMDEERREPIRGQRILKDLGGNYGSWDPITLVWREGVWEPGLCEAKPFPRPKTDAERRVLYRRIYDYLVQMALRSAPVLCGDIGETSLGVRVRRREKIAWNDLNAAEEWMLNEGLAQLVKIKDKGPYIRPRDHRYPEEQPWRTISP